MPKRDADLLIEDIETAITRIEGYIAGLDREAFLQDQKAIDAVVQPGDHRGSSSLAAVRVQGAAWLSAVVADCRLRNRIVHDYFGLDLEIVWQVLQTSLPQFERQLASIRS